MGANARKPGCSGSPISLVPAPEAFQQNGLSTSTLDNANTLPLLSSPITATFIWLTKGRVPLCPLVRDRWEQRGKIISKIPATVRPPTEMRHQWGSGRQNLRPLPRPSVVHPTGQQGHPFRLWLMHHMRPLPPPISRLMHWSGMERTTHPGTSEVSMLSQLLPLS